MVDLDTLAEANSLCCKNGFRDPVAGKGAETDPEKCPKEAMSLIVINNTTQSEVENVIIEVMLPRL